MASTNVVYAGLDWLAPQTKTIASADFPSAHHDCGCKTAEQCRLHCCCHPTPRERQTCSLHAPQQETVPPESVQVKVTHFSAARCRGQAAEDFLMWHKLDPHLPPARPLTLASKVAGAAPSAEPPAPPPVFPPRPDKIPI